LHSCRSQSIELVFVWGCKSLCSPFSTSPALSLCFANDSSPILDIPASSEGRTKHRAGTEAIGRVRSLLGKHKKQRRLVRKRQRGIVSKARLHRTRQQPRRRQRLATTTTHYLDTTNSPTLHLRLTNQPSSSTSNITISPPRPLLLHSNLRVTVLSPHSHTSPTAGVVDPQRNPYEYGLNPPTFTRPIPHRPPGPPPERSNTTLRSHEQRLRDTRNDGEVL